MPFGEYLTALREKRNIGLVALGKKMKFSPSYLSRVEHNTVPPSDKLLNALVRELKDFGLYAAAGKVIPEDFLPRKLLDLTRLVPEAEKQWAIDSYPQSDPWGGYGHDLPDLLDDSDLSLENVDRLYELGIMPGDIDIYPPLRKKIYGTAFLKSQWPHTNDKERELQHNFLDGEVAGIKEAFEVFNKIQRENGNYALLAAFYSPQIAKALDNYLQTLKELGVKDIENNPPVVQIDKNINNEVLAKIDIETLNNELSVFEEKIRHLLETKDNSELNPEVAEEINILLRKKRHLEEMIQLKKLGNHK